MYTSELMQKVEFLNGTFTPSEARDILLKVIDHQINFYKLQHLSNWIKDHSVSQDLQKERIAQLEDRKRELAELITEARAEEARLTIHGDFNISLER